MLRTTTVLAATLLSPLSCSDDDAAGGDPSDAGEPTDLGSSADSGIPAFDPLQYHAGFWSADVGGAVLINDMHFDVQTRRATVYAQLVVGGNVLSPPQISPGECTTSSGETVCFHPNAVYLNGRGIELEASDASGEWWVKHSWIVDGQGYDNCEPFPLEENWECLPTIGVLAADGLTMDMRVGEWGQPGAFNNLRRPEIDADPMTYTIETWQPANIDASAGEIDLTRTLIRTQELSCQSQPSPLDNQVRPCPVRAD